MTVNPEKVVVTDSVTYKLGKVKSKVAYIAKKVRPDRLLQARRDISSKVRVAGWVEVRLIGPDGELKYFEEGPNLITDIGDERIARRFFDDAIPIVTGMRLGNDSATAVSKAGAGAAAVEYISGSNEDLDAAATHSDKGSGLGYRATHICTWVAADVIDNDIEEAVLSDETPLTDVAGGVSDTVARFIFASTIDKQAGDSLEITWHIDILGA